MRRVAFVFAAALALSGSAAATSRPPLPRLHLLKALPVIDLERSSSHDRGTCSTHAHQAKGTVARVHRKLAPVACEQPPRSHVQDAGSVIVLTP